MVSVSKILSFYRVCRGTCMWLAIVVLIACAVKAHAIQFTLEMDLNEPLIREQFEKAQLFGDGNMRDIEDDPTCNSSSDRSDYGTADCLND